MSQENGINSGGADQPPAPAGGKAADRPFPTKGYALAVSAVWTILVAASLFWNLEQDSRTQLELAAAQARMAYEKDVAYRRWNANLGGVYVPLTERTPPNPHLRVPERDLTTPGGKRLTLMNPAYMTRMVHELGFETMGLRGHITSLRPLRPENSPDPWEAEALRAFEEGRAEVISQELVEGKPFLRFMRPLKYEEGCRLCHESQGYRIGEVQGGISVSIPLEPLFLISYSHRFMEIGTHAAIWLIGLAGTWLAVFKIGGHQRERDRAQREREAALTSLIEARNEVKTLSGLLPICASCKKIRDDQGDWQGIENYIQSHSQADFTHAICPECMNKLYPGLDGTDPAKGGGSR